MNKLVLLIILNSIVYFSNLGGNSIYILDEAKNAGCAMEMKDRGDWIVPTFNNQLRTDKPPLHYFFMMASYSIFGVTPFAARFFSAIAGILLILLVYKNVKHLINESVAFYTALILLSSIQLTIQFHLAVPDPYLILLIAFSLFSFFKGYHVDSKQLKWFYIASALGFLCKGLVAIVLPGLIILLYLGLTQSLNWTTLKNLKIGMGIILFCVLALPWYAAVGFATDGEWLRGFFFRTQSRTIYVNDGGSSRISTGSIRDIIGGTSSFLCFLCSGCAIGMERKEGKTIASFLSYRKFGFCWILLILQNDSTQLSRTGHTIPGNCYCILSLSIANRSDETNQKSVDQFISECIDRHHRVHCGLCSIKTRRCNE